MALKKVDHMNKIPMGGREPESLIKEVLFVNKQK